MESSFQFPAVASNDPSDVATAIETARALWRRGDSHESLRWLRRAAESAEAEGDDMRALSLARAAADLQEQFRPSAPPPSARSAPPPSVRPAPPPSAPKSGPPPLNRSSVPASASTQSVPPAPKLEPWTPPASRSESHRAPPPLPAALEAAPAPAAPAPAPEVSTPAAPVSTTAAKPKSEAASAPRGTGDPRTALRVSVEVLSRSSGTLLVRMLGADDEPPPGASEALLVPLEAGLDLREL